MVFCFFCSISCALFADTPNQKAEFKSDLAECIQRKNENVCVYSGQAYFAQEDIKLWAPTITIYRDITNKIVKIIAKGDDKGNQGHYHFVPSQEQKGKNDVNNQPLDAQADVIKMYPPKNLMVLEGHAQVVRKYDKMIGSYIEYDTNKQTVFSKPAVKEGTTIVLYPKKDKEIK